MTGGGTIFPIRTYHWAPLRCITSALSQTPALRYKTTDTGPVHRAVCLVIFQLSLVGYALRLLAEGWPG